MINSVFNKWTVIELADKDQWGSIRYRCRCECGRESVVRKCDLTLNKSLQCRDCGYLNKRKGVIRLISPLRGLGNNYRHGMNTTPSYKSWSSMINRCADHGKNSKWYKDRNISACDEWKQFINFYRDMGDRPEGFYLDRIDNDKGYYKDNCRWASPTVSSRNRRTVVKDMATMEKISTVVDN